MQSFKEFIVNEAKQAIDFENYITVAFNGKSGHNVKGFKANSEAAQKIAKAIKKKVRGTKMVHNGSGQGKTVSWWEGAPTPKTDVYTDSGANISLKSSRTKSQLLSGKTGEARSVFRAALKHSHAQDAEALAREVLDSMKEFIIPDEKRGKVTINQFTKKAKEGKKQYNKALNDMAKEFVEADKMRAVMTKKLNAYFENDPNFKNWFVYEAATGHIKFSPEGKAGHSAANWLVEFNAQTGEVTKIGELSKNNRPTKLVAEIAERVKFSIRWKTPHGTGPSTYLSLRADVFESIGHDTVWSLLEQEVARMDESFLKDTKALLTNLFRKVLNAIKKAAKYGYEALLSFLGFDIKQLQVRVTGL